MLHVREWPNNYFIGRWIGRGGPKEWSPRSQVLFHVISLCRVGPPRTPDDELEQQIRYNFIAVLFCFFNEKCRASVFQVAKLLRDVGGGG